MVTFFSSPDQRVKSPRKITLARENKYTFKIKDKNISTKLHLVSCGDIIELFLTISLRVPPRAAGQARVKHVCATCFRHKNPWLGPSIYTLVSGSCCLRPPPNQAGR